MSQSVENRAEFFKLGIVLSIGNCVAQSKSSSAPFWVAAMITELSVPTRMGGLIVGAEFLTLALAILVATVLRERVGQLRFFAAGMLLSAVGNIVCLLNGGIAGVLIGRMTAGIGEGTLYVAVYSLAAKSLHRTRLYSTMQAAVLVYVVLVMMITPIMIELYGFRGAFLFLLAFSLLGLCVTPWMRTRSAHVSSQAVQQPIKWTVAALLLSGVVLLSIGQMGIWTYSGVIGASLGLSFRAIAYAVMAALLLSAFVVAVVPRMAARFGIAAIYVAGSILLAIGTVTFSLAVNVPSFIVALAAASTGYIIVITLTYSIFGARDPSGGLVSLTAIPVHIGSSIGAMTMGVALEWDGEAAFGFVAVAFTFLGAMLVLKFSPASSPMGNKKPSSAPVSSG